MMKWYCLDGADQRHNNWILYSELEEGGALLRDRYRDRACPSCGKLDEYSAIRSGIDHDVRLVAIGDVVNTSEDFLCFSKRAEHVCKERNIVGLDFVPLPCGKYSIVIPCLFVEVDVQRSGMQFSRQCMLCGRFDEATGGPGMDALGVKDNACAALIRAHQGKPLYEVSLTVPANPLQVFEPRVINEGSGGRRTQLHVSEIVRGVFKSECLAGAQFFEIG